MPAEFICKTDHVIAIYQPGEGKTLTITFNSAAEKPNGLYFSGDQFLGKLKRPAIGIVSTSANWYPKLAMRQIVEAVNEVQRAEKFERVVAYGHSLGGYGALRFGADLNVDVAIAFSPQVSVDPAYTSHSNNFWDQIDPTLRGGMEIEAHHIGRRNYVVYDPHIHHDRWAANRLHSLMRTERVIFPIAGHMTFTVLVNGRRVAEFVDALVDGDVHEGRRQLRAARCRSWLYHVHLAQLLTASSRLTEAAAVASRAVNLAPHELKAVICHALALMKIGARDAAIEALLNSNPFQSKIGWNQKVLLRHLVEAKEFDLAKALVKSAMQVPDLLVFGRPMITSVLDEGDVRRLLADIQPGSREIRRRLDEWHHLASILSKRGMHSVAADVCAHIVTVDSSNTSLRMQLIRELKAAGRIEEAILAGRATEELPLTLQQHRLLATIYRELQHWSGIERVVSHVLATHPDFFDLRSLAIEACFNMGDLARIDAHLEEAAALSGDRANILMPISRLYSRLAAAYERAWRDRENSLHAQEPSERREAARVFALRAVSLEPLSVMNRMVLAEAQIDVNEKEAAAETLDFILLNLEPTDAAHWIRIAELCENAARPDGAIQAARCALRAARFANWHYFLAGRILLRNAQREEALAVFAKLLISRLNANEMSIFKETLARFDLLKEFESTISREVAT